MPESLRAKAAWTLISLALLAVACAPRARFPSRPAKKPATAKELASVPVTVLPARETPPQDAAEVAEMAARVAKALRARGFNVSDQPARHLDLELTVGLEPVVPGASAASSPLQWAAVLTTDGFFVDWAVAKIAPVERKGPELLDALAAALAEGLAGCEGLADYYRYPGVPGQAMFGN